MSYAPACRFAIGVSTLALAAVGCGGGSSSTGSGGNNASGGNGSGGSGSGGVIILTGSGGNSASGGSSGSSGSTGSGGNGSGGSVSSGGSTGSGGNQSTGGNSGSGGSTGSGGSASSGGSTGSGGNSASGGSSGSTGSGGNAGSTGRGGSSAGSTGSGGAGGSGAATFFTDDFESDTSGKQPAGFDNLIAYIFNNTSNPAGDGTLAVADGTHVHGGKMAVHFHGAGNPAFLELKLPASTNHLYSRVWVYSSVQLGNGPSSDNHETLLGITGDPTSANTQVRFGMIKGAVGTNQVPTDNIAPVMAKWYMAPSISANTWHCIEVEFDGSASYNTLNAYSDGTLVHSIAAGTDWANGALPATWMSGMFTDFMFGWQSFSSTTADVWMDDLALSSKGRIGCN
jgi:hypothetical protein